LGTLYAFQIKRPIRYDGSNSASAAIDLACVHAITLSASFLIITSIKGSTAPCGNNPEEAKNELSIAGQRVFKLGITVETQILSRG
jgi:hypothetical protein